MVSAFYFDRGNFAPVQQDALVLETAALGRREEALLVVCDGIGGLEEGEFASSYVTMRIRNWFYESYLKKRKRGGGRRRMERDCVSMLYDCNRYLQSYGKERGIKLGTTVTMALLHSRKILWRHALFWPVKYAVFHTGDSRAYLIGRGCKKLTEDDSCGNSVLHRCIGSFPWRGVQKRRGYLWPGEKILLCSDGFWRKLEAEEMTECFGNKGRLGRDRNAGLSEDQAEKRLRKLGQVARARGERDNQAAVAVSVEWAME